MSFTEIFCIITVEEKLLLFQHRLTMCASYYCKKSKQPVWYLGDKGLTSFFVLPFSLLHPSLRALLNLVILVHFFFITSSFFIVNLTASQLNRHITLLWHCSHIYLCHFMVILTCHIRTPHLIALRFLARWKWRSPLPFSPEGNDHRCSVVFLFLCSLPNSKDLSSLSFT